MKKKGAKIIVVDDHNLFREGIKYLLTDEESFEIVGQASNGQEFLDLMETADIPDIVFMDINMPEMNGIEACQAATKKYPGINIIALTMNEDQEYYFQMIKAGAKGFVLKNAGKDKLIEAIHEVLNGGSYFPEDILRKIIFKFGTEDSVENKIEKKFGLSNREKEVLSFLCQGYTNIEIGEKLFLSPKTVEGHRANLLSKTGTKNSAHLVMFAIKNGIIKI
jgi:DNA-binding NarL/FixJ family response regulator